MRGGHRFYLDDTNSWSPADQSLYFVLTSSMPKVRFSTYELIRTYVLALQAGDTALFSGYYIDLDSAGTDFGTLLTDAMNRGAVIIFLFDSLTRTSPAIEASRRVVQDNPNGIWALPTNRVPDSQIGLQEHLKLNDFFYFGPQGSVPKLMNRAACFNGSANPFYPQTLETGLWTEGIPERHVIVRQQLRRDATWLQKFTVVQPDGMLSAKQQMLGATIAQLLQYAGSTVANKPTVPLKGGGRIYTTYETDEATVVWPTKNPSQCWSGQGTTQESRQVRNPGQTVTPGFYPTSTSLYTLPRVRYNMGIMPRALLDHSSPYYDANFSAAFLSADDLLVDICNRSQRFFRMFLFQTYLSESTWGRVGNIPGWHEALKAAYKRGVNLIIYAGLSNNVMPDLDAPDYSSFINYITDGGDTSGLTIVRFNAHSAISLHAKIYMSERDVLISNNHPAAAFYETTIWGNDIIFYDCAPIRTFYENLFNAVFSHYSVGSALGYCKDPSDASTCGYTTVPHGLSVRNNLLACGDGVVQTPGGCCLMPQDVYQRPTPYALVSFVPSYVEDPYDLNNFYQVMLREIYSARKFIILINQFIQLGGNEQLWPVDQEWLRVPPRPAVNAAFQDAIQTALDAGAMLYVCSGAANTVDTQGQYVWDYGHDTVSPTWHPLYPQQVVPVTLGAYAAFIDTLGNLETNYFDHDKLYATENCVYVGGQNWYPPLEFDAGFVVWYGNPLYNDLLSRSWAMAGLGYSAMQTSLSKPFSGLFVDKVSGRTWNGSAYITISAQTNNPPVKLGGSGEPNAGNANASATINMGGQYVSGILDATLAQFYSATGHLYVTCWAMSPVETFNPPPAPFAVDPTFQNGLRAALARPEVKKCTVILCIHSEKYALFNEFDRANPGAANTYCNKLASFTGHGTTGHDAMTSFYNIMQDPKVTLYLYGNPYDRVPTKIGNCNFMHAKTVVSDTSMSASSANFTPGYFYAVANTGLNFDFPNADAPATPMHEQYVEFITRTLAMGAVPATGDDRYTGMCVTKWTADPQYNTGYPCLSK